MVAIPRFVSTGPEAAARIAGYAWGDGNPDVQDNTLGGPAFTFIGDDRFQEECVRCAGVLGWTAGTQYRITSPTGNFRVLRSALYAALGITSPTHNMYYRALEPTATFTPTRVEVESFLASVIETEGQADSNPPKVFDDARGGTYDQRIDALVLTLNTQNLGAFRSGSSVRVNLAALDAFPMPFITAARYPGDEPADWPDGAPPAPDTTPPSVPTGLAASVGDGQVSLTWNIVTALDLAGYRIYRNGVEVYEGVTPALLDTGLTNAVAYNYTVASYDTTGNASAQSSAISATPEGPPVMGEDTTPPDTPTGLTATPASTQVSLTWTASVATDVTSYLVYRGSDLVATVASPATFYIDTGLTEETLYTYRITALDTTGNESLSTDFVSATTQDAVVEPPPITVAPYQIIGTLGCAALYEVYVADRSGQTLLRQLPFTSLSWGRAMDEVSAADIGVDLVNGPQATECCRAIAGLARWAYEIIVFRDGTQVWNGPVVDIVLDGPNARVTAEDKLAWTKVRVTGALDYPEPGEDVGVIFNAIVNAAMAPDNVPGLVPTATATGIRAVREYTSNPPQIAYDAIQELARTGVDYTMVGPDMVAGSFVVPTPPIAYLTDQSVVAAPRIEFLGSNVATQWLVVGDPEEEIVATYGGVDPTVGLVVRIAQEDEISDQASLDQNARTRWELTSSTSVGLVTLELDPGAPLPLELAIPGAVVDLRLSDSCSPLTGQFRLKDLSVDVSASDGLSETITISVEPLGTEIVT